MVVTPWAVVTAKDSLPTKPNLQNQRQKLQQQQGQPSQVVAGLCNCHRSQPERENDAKIIK
jgi:hypothetical protein